MKIALYVEEGLEQVVLTPEGDVEKSILAKMEGRALTVRKGSFYECRGGYVRQGRGDDSTMIVLRDFPKNGPLDELERGIVPGSQVSADVVEGQVERMEEAFKPQSQPQQ